MSNSARGVDLTLILTHCVRVDAGPIGVRMTNKVRCVALFDSNTLRRTAAIVSIVRK